MFENRRRGRQARNFTTNAPKILDLKSSSEQIFSRKLPLGAPDWNLSISLLLMSDNKKQYTARYRFAMVISLEQKEKCDKR